MKKERAARPTAKASPRPWLDFSGYSSNQCFTR
jgi:hypothetical protein